MSFTRETLTLERVAQITAEMQASGKYQPLTPEERERSLREILAHVRSGEDVWLFGYGSLMWNPMVHHTERRPGLVHGYHRRYCFWVRMGRGSPEVPGLMLGLDRGGSCRGMAFRIPADLAEAELTLIWRREMLSGAYCPRWVDVRTDEGRIRAVTFVANPHCPQYARTVPLDIAAAHIARAEGWLGTCREYLEKTISQLKALGFSDRYLNRMHGLVQALPADDPGA